MALMKRIWSCNGSLFSRKMPQSPRRGVLVGRARRGILTEIQEPPLHSNVPEKPCTLILAQDDGMYTNESRASWSAQLSDSLVNSHGIAFAEWTLPVKDNSMDAALQEMRRDLAPIPSPVWIARGPLMSWMAQFYLESLALSGLVLVDPLPLDQDDGVRTLEAAFLNSFAAAREEESRSSILFQEYANHWDHWSLKLEAGAVPMMVVSTEEEWKWAADKAVERHSTIESPVAVLHCYGDIATEKILLSEISAWIEEEVL